MSPVIVSAAKDLGRVVAMLAVATSLEAQSLSARVANAPDGIVRMQLDGRPGVCGDGRDLVGYGSALFGRNFQSFGGHWSDTKCRPGPLRVTVDVDHGQVTRLRTQVGGTWYESEGKVTDLGLVPAREASAYFFSLVPKLEVVGEKDRLLLPAVLANDAPVIEPLLALARDDGRRDHTRRSAIMWLGIVGDASVVPALAGFAREGIDDDEAGKRSKKSLGTTALAALSTLEGGVGVPALIDLARTGGVGTRREAVFWLGQNGDPRALRMLHTVIENASESNKVRAHAIFALTHGGDTPESEFAWLRSVYARLDGDELKESIIQGMQEDEGAGGRWLIERALDRNEPTKLRRNAIFWAGQREETPTAELVRVYRETENESLREHAIFVLSQRQDDAATDALIRIARDDEDRRMRSKALFWLGQKDDPRARKLIADLILK